MKPRRPSPPTDETRAEIARRRLAQLAASFDAELPPADEPEQERVRRALELPHAKVLATIAVAASVLLVWWLLSGRPKTTEPAAPLAFGTSTAPAGAAKTPEAELIIDVVGKVRKPGIVTVPKGSRVYQAIEAAGGLKGRVDTASLNMARVLDDGEQILVGIEPVAAPAASGPAGSGGPAGGKVNLNTATAEQLDMLPGVGPVTAQAILAWRDENGRFGSVEDLLDVKGIGDATLAELRDLVTL
ncbi:helix-hairpin-helix domain-containing protein [Aeromicrobium ginsengisoli]|uniref:ComEA family DNA-binding protein n=1 Tax=Aeromicrobium ginsengisoli TaxID=363867 RepID=A0A5M4FIF9_9ACTN|nr:helix-hairpin-helix domain-containing protein [Aeromicrobium ginsengisoli]KAA1399966.1 ComEA family DNA-binding protein [Aeromicrobium ginsengisoli]